MLLRNIACVHNAYNMIDRASQPVVNVCTERGIAFVPRFPLDSYVFSTNPVLGNPVVQKAAADPGVHDRSNRVGVDSVHRSKGTADSRYVLVGAPR